MKNAIEHILKRDKNAHFYVFSDDEEYCYNYHLFQNLNKTNITQTNEINTLYLMYLCKKGGICSNSTFSWWGSYLNDNPKKTVIFPRKWYNKNIRNDIYYDGSLILDA